MTPEQVEKVRGELLHLEREADSHMAAFRSSPSMDNPWLTVRDRARSALAALNGEPEEEVWTVSRRYACHEDLAFRLHDHNNDFVASDLGEATARRIARLPALERAAREVVQTFGGGLYLDIAVDIVGAVTALRAALDKTEA